MERYVNPTVGKNTRRAARNPGAEPRMEIRGQGVEITPLGLGWSKSRGSQTRGHLDGLARQSRSFASLTADFRPRLRFCLREGDDVGG